MAVAWPNRAKKQMIFAVSGPPGSGKTHWIRECLAKSDGQPSRYFSPQTDSMPIDSICIDTEFSQVEIIGQTKEGNLFDASEAATYIELPWHLDLSSIEPQLQKLNCHRVAVLPSGSNLSALNKEWQTWADEVVFGNTAQIPEWERSATNPPQVHRALLRGEIFDFASLAVFWFELIQGAYGEAIRAKGIFDIISGESIYGDFVAGTVNREFMALELPRWLDGRPQRFSGLEIVGWDLNREAIAQTIEDCSVPETHIAHYQEQMKQSLDVEPEETEV